MGSSEIPKAVLVVSGAWHVPSHYRKLVAALEEKGIRTICPCLPTNNNAVPPNKTILDDIALIRDIAAAEAARGTHLTVLAHSYGGAVTTAALGDLAYPIRGNTAGGGVTSLIFMASFLIKEGETLVDLCGGNLPPFVYAQEDGTLEVENPAYFFFNDLPDDEARAAVDMMVTHQKAAQYTRIECGKAAWRLIPTSYLICEGDTALLPPFQEIIIARMRGEGVDVREYRCAGGHDPFLSMPDKVVEVVLKDLGSR